MDLNRVLFLKISSILIMILKKIIIFGSTVYYKTRSITIHQQSIIKQLNVCFNDKITLHFL